MWKTTQIHAGRVFATIDPTLPIASIHRSKKEAGILSIPPSNQAICIIINTIRIIKEANTFQQHLPAGDSPLMAHKKIIYQRPNAYI